MFEAVRRVVRDESFGGGLFAAAGNANEAKVVAEILVRRCDRRGFGGAVRSPRFPELQHRGLAVQVAEINLSTVQSRKVRRRYRFGGPCG